MNQSETQPPKRKNRKQNLWENEKKRNTLHQQDIPKNKRLTPHQLIPNPLGFYEYMWLKVEVWLQWLLKYIFMFNYFLARDVHFLIAIFVHNILTV